MNSRDESREDEQPRAERDQSEENEKQSRPIRMRDLNPEKDPMGAANELAAPNE